MLKFISETYNVPYFYRQVATKAELTYYIKQFCKKEYSNFDVFYFSFHGNRQIIQLEGEKEHLSLDELADLSDNLFKDKFVHFSSCRTLLGSTNPLDQFKSKTGAKVVTGYTKSVDTTLSAILDVALIGEFFTHKQIPSIFNNLEKRFGGLQKELGFKVLK